MADRVGLVVAGAGARGAYEAGALAELLPRLEREGTAPSILVGTSAGALNVIALAAGADPARGGLAAAVDEVVRLWSTVRLGDVTGLLGSLVRDALGYSAQVVAGRGRLVSLLDTSRVVELLGREVDWDRLHDNVRRGVVEAVAVAATSAATGGTVVFVERRDRRRRLPADRKRDITYVDVERLTPEHAAASAAIPVAFRPVLVEEPPGAAGWYVDGGVRLNAPIKPALALGAGRVVVVATHPDRYPPAPRTLPPPGDTPPDLWSAAGHLLRGALSDRMVEDLHTLGSVNALVHGHPTPPRGRREVEFVFAGPQNEAEALSIADAAEEAFRHGLGPAALVRHPDVALLSRLVGGSPEEHGELLSYLFFDPAFTTRAVELGREHAARSRGWETTY